MSGSLESRGSGQGTDSRAALESQHFVPPPGELHKKLRSESTRRTDAQDLTW